MFLVLLFYFGVAESCRTSSTNQRLLDRSVKKSDLYWRFCRFDIWTHSCSFIRSLLIVTERVNRADKQLTYRTVSERSGHERSRVRSLSAEASTLNKNYSKASLYRSSGSARLWSRLIWILQGEKEHAAFDLQGKNTQRWWAAVEELKVIRSNGCGWGRAVAGGLNAAALKPLMSAVMRVSWDWSRSASRLASDWFQAIRNPAGCMDSVIDGSCLDATWPECKKTSACVCVKECVGLNMSFW